MSTDPLLRDTAIDAARERGYACQDVGGDDADGAEADGAGDERCELVITDAIDQLGVLRERVAPGGVLLAVTEPDATEIAAAIAAGADDFVTRPAVSHALAARIALAVRRTGAEHQRDAVVANVPLIAFYLDAAGVIRLAGGKGIEPLGLSANRLIGLPLVALFEDQPALLEDVRSALAGRSFRGDVALGDQSFEGNFEPVCTSRGEVIGLVLTLADVSKRARVEDALRRSEASFRTLIESSPDAIFVHRFGRLLYVNATVVSLLGYGDTAEVIGRPVLEFIDPEDRDAAGELIRQVHATGDVLTQELRLLRVDGGHVITEMRTIPMVFDGEPAIVAIGRDVTERKRLQAQLVQTDRLVSLGTLAAGISHEINNPLAFMGANLDYVSDVLRRIGAEHPEALPADERDEVAVALGDTIDGTARITEIVRSLSFFTRTEDDPKGCVDVADVLDNAIRMAWSELREVAQVTIDYQTTAAIQGDYSSLSQAFFNLLANAAQAQASQEAPTRQVMVILRDGDATHPGPGGNDDDTDSAGWVVVEIADTGPGIPASAIKNIFDPFFSTKPVGQGTGLGLSVCHSTIAAAGGTIDVASVDDSGCTFWVRLPRAADSTPGPVPQPRRRVVVVEDDMWTLRTLLDALRGHHVIVATSAEGAERACRDQSVDLIIGDVRLARDEPQRFLERLRQMGRAPAPSIAWLASSADDTTAMDGRWPRLIKPLESHAIRAVLAPLA